jgi:hypothetical protein
MVIEHATSMTAKLDAYHLKHTILFSSPVPSENIELMQTVLVLLASLGENILPVRARLLVTAIPMP